MGNLIAALDRRLNKGKHKKGKGVLLLIIVLFVATSIVVLLTWFAFQIHLILGIIVEAIIIATTIAQKDLGTAAMRVYEPLEKGSLDEARTAVSMIVGRDTATLDEEGITRATVETVAESIGDGITSPLFWALIGGAPLAIAYRAANTCDSMVGYKNEKYEDFGWASARFDDVLNWIPSRITGFLMMLTRRIPNMNKSAALSQWRKDAKKHASPNSGWLEAATALSLGVQLGGVNYYRGIRSERAYMGKGQRVIEKTDIIHTIKMMQQAVFIFLVFLWIGGMLLATAVTWF
jgi:adenosylcobinamide-phosphate synthase